MVFYPQFELSMYNKERRLQNQMDVLYCSATFCCWWLGDALQAVVIYINAPPFFTVLFCHHQSGD